MIKKFRYEVVAEAELTSHPRMSAKGFLDSYHLWRALFYFMGRRKEKPVPEGYRKLELTYIEPIPVNCVGVYCLFFGNHFYIGKSVNVRARLGQHRLGIDRLLWRTLSGRAPKVVGSYIRIVQHLIENKDIVTMDALLLYIARSEEDALSEEWCWLNFLQSYVLNYRCLNKMEYLAEYPMLGDLHWGQECFFLG